MREVIADKRSITALGRQGENEATAVKFSISGWEEQYGEGAFELLNQRPSESTPYTCSITVDDEYVTWIIQLSDVAKVGHGKCELTYVVDGTVAKSIQYATCVLESIEGGGTVPAPYESRIHDLIEASANVSVNAERAEEAAENAEQSASDAETAKDAAEEAQRKAESASAHAAYIDTETKHWIVWNTETEAYVDSGVVAEGVDGEDGFSPTVEVEEISSGHKVTITDEEGDHEFDVPDGTDGTSPSVTIETIEGGHSVTITDADHPEGQTFNVMDGEDGSSDAGEVSYDPEAEYDDGTVGAALNQQSATIVDLGTDLSAEVTRATAKDIEQDDRLKFLEAVNEGKTFITETDSTEAYSKTIKSNVIPEGNKALVQSIGGKTVVKNQLAPAMTGGYAQYNFATLITYSDNVATIKSNGSSGSSGADINYRQLSIPVGSKILFSVKCKKNFTHDCEVKIQSDGTSTIKIGDLSEEYSTFSYVFTANSNVVRIGVAFPTVYFDYSETVNIKEFEIIVLSRWFNGDSTILSSITTPEDAYALGVPREYIPYNAGELISADCDALVSRGKNLWNPSDIERKDRYILDDSGNESSSSVSGYTLNFLKINETFFVSNGLFFSPNNYRVYFYDINKTFISRTEGLYAATAIVPPQGTEYVRFQYIISALNANINKIQVEKGNVGTSFSPYVGTLGTLEIPSALRTAHPLRSAGNVYDTLEFKKVNNELKVEHHKRINSIDLGTLNYTINSPSVFVYTSLSDGVDSNNMLSIYVNRGADTSASNLNNMELKMARATKKLFIRNDSYTDSDEFKTAMSGVMLNYNLAEEVLTDVTDFFPADFINQLVVESGGTVTFEQTDTEFPVPNTISYLRKVATA